MVTLIFPKQFSATESHTLTQSLLAKTGTVKNIKKEKIKTLVNNCSASKLRNQIHS